MLWTCLWCIGNLPTVHGETGTVWVYEEVEWFDKVSVNSGKNFSCASRNFAGVPLQMT